MSKVNVNTIEPETGTTLTLGASGDTISIPSGATIANSGTATGIGLFSSYAIIADQKTSRTASGTATGGSVWRTRDLNTEVADPDGIVSIASNRFTLAAGSYFITWDSPFYMTDYARTRLYDYTNTAGVGVGGSGFTTSTSDRAEQTYWTGGSARVTPSGSTVYEIQYECQTTRAGNGLGNEDAAGADVEQFTIVEIFKEA